MRWWEPLAAYWSRKRWERLQYEQACKVLESIPASTLEDDDAARWKLVSSSSREPADLACTRDRARHLVEHNPFARNALTLYRNYVVGTGMQHEVLAGSVQPSEDIRFERRFSPLTKGESEGVLSTVSNPTQPPLSKGRRTDEQIGDARVPHWVERAGGLWRHFLDQNHWDTGSRRDWEFCLRTWRDGECFLRMFRQSAWPPRVHFVDPERIVTDPATALPTEGIATETHNVEVPTHYRVQHDDERAELVPADRMLHCKIGVDGNVKRGQSLFVPVLDALQKYQSWLDVELIHRKVASSIVLVRKHAGSSPSGITNFADWSAQASQPAASITPQQRKALLQPGTIIDAQGYDLQYLSPDSHFDDATILGRRLLLAVAAGTGLPEFMLTADAGNANYSSTLVSEGPAVKLFASWQAFFIGQWQTLFQLVMTEAVRLGLLPAEALEHVRLRITPPAVAVRNRKDDAEADAIYFDRGALSRRELARRDQADPTVMERERGEEK
ncbi:MAG TPA: phage portal protein [Gemmatales bacterium]|nr:phage portal protein [Gemmatales bacterium]